MYMNDVIFHFNIKYTIPPGYFSIPANQNVLYTWQKKNATQENICRY